MFLSGRITEFNKDAGWECNNLRIWSCIEDAYCGFAMFANVDSVAVPNTFETIRTDKQSVIFCCYFEEVWCFFANAYLFPMDWTPCGKKALGNFCADGISHIHVRSQPRKPLAIDLTEPSWKQEVAKRTIRKHSPDHSCPPSSLVSPKSGGWCRGGSRNVEGRGTPLIENKK